MDTRSTRRAASRTHADGPGVEDEAGADGTAETSGHQPSPGETVSPVPLLETVRARLADICDTVRDALARPQPTALPKLDVPAFTGQAVGASVIDFLDDHYVYRETATARGGKQFPHIAQGHTYRGRDRIETTTTRNALCTEEFVVLRGDAIEEAAKASKRRPEISSEQATQPKRPALGMSRELGDESGASNPEEGSAQESQREDHASYPATAIFIDALPPVPFTISPLGPVFRNPPPRGRIRTVATWTVLDSADHVVAWTSRLPRELQPRPLLGDLILDAPEPFRGLLPSDRHPIEPPQPYTTEETRILCPTCRVPEISRRAHQVGSLHRSRLLALTIRDTVPRPQQPPPAPTTVEAAVAPLHSTRPDFLAQGALLAPISVATPNLPPQPPVDDLLYFEE
ncbi:hypothetical protein HPB52_021256 [Rhipicephalus sanguineus]|uniref:Uncharacterized protein n=1 Tax=Rhipicephalus sanguineus TaxID=34632 RepID=A0A9D4Q350_RHISA|nr:hypothetical protein HPB52_021256 [Rhipicephalus sanguineus]